MQIKKVFHQEDFSLEKIIRTILNLRYSWVSLGSKDSNLALKMDKSLKCNENFEKLNELQEISQKAIKLFGSEADLQENARLTKLCRDIKLSISNDKNDPKLMELIEVTEKAGSLCTRIMGAGGGGFFICWAPEYRHQAIKDSIK